MSPREKKPSAPPPEAPEKKKASRLRELAAAGAVEPAAAPPPTPAAEEAPPAEPVAEATSAAKGKAKSKDKPPAKGKKAAAVERMSGFRRGNTLQRPKHWSTGNFALDLALGGGLLRGRFHQFWGMPSAGKTEKVLRALGMMQRTCRMCMTPLHSCTCENPTPAEVAYVQTEGDWDDVWARRLGVDTDALMLGLPEAGDSILNEVVDLLRERKIDVIAIDSLAFMTTTKEVDADVTRESVGEQARMFGKAFRKMMSLIVAQQAAAIADPTTRLATVITTNQIRYKVGVMFGNPETVGGGEAPKFANSTETRCSKVKIIETKAQGAVACTAKIKVSKNKTYRPFQQAEYTFALYPHDGYRTGQLMDEKAVVSAAIQAGFCGKHPDGTGLSFFGDRFSTAAQIGARLASDAAYKWRATQAIIKAVVEGDAAVEMEVSSDDGEDGADAPEANDDGVVEE